LAAGIWWGENLQGAAAYPVDVGETRLGIGKVIYSPHTYGPATGPQKQFSAASFPTNMPAIWDTQWAHLPRRNLAPIVIGEFGGLCSGQDLTLQQALIAFMAEREIGGFWWSVNPDSADTGGLVTSWESVNPETVKLGLLSSLPGTRVPTSSARASAATTHTGPSRSDSTAVGHSATAYPSIRDPRPSPPLFPPVYSPPPSAVALKVVVVGSGSPTSASWMSRIGWPPPLPAPPSPGPTAPPNAPEAQMSAAAFGWGALGVFACCIIVSIFNYLQSLEHRLSFDAKQATAKTRSALGTTKTRSKTKGRPKASANVWQAVPEYVEEQPTAFGCPHDLHLDDVEPEVEADSGATELSELARALAAVDAAAAAVRKIQSRA